MSRLAFCKMREFDLAGFIWEAGWEPGLYHVEDGGSPGVAGPLAVGKSARGGPLPRGGAFGDHDDTSGYTVCSLKQILQGRLNAINGV